MDHPVLRAKSLSQNIFWTSLRAALQRYQPLLRITGQAREQSLTSSGLKGHTCRHMVGYLQHGRAHAYRGSVFGGTGLGQQLGVVSRYAAPEDVSHRTTHAGSGLMISRLTFLLYLSSKMG
ncbi:MAG: hypothetical protein HW380_918 [Magnetococcales bacterium]|nr:hypothetical protein [Magnetococcales bacterium]